EANVVANDAAGGAAEASQVPQSPPVSPKDLGTSKQVMGGAILKLVNRVKRLEKQAHLRRRKLVIADSDEEAEVATEVAAAKEDDIDLDEITALATTALGPKQPAVPTENVEPMQEQEEM
nr:hypothetical protein [Tanacetum cinerariifolium]